MGQLGFSDLDKRYRSLDAKKDPLVFLNEVVPWEEFRARLSAVWRKPEEERKNAAGRKPWDEIVIFQTLVLQALYNLSDDQLEYQTSSSIRSATGSRSCASWDWASRIGSPTPRRSGCIARSSPKRGWSRRCSRPSMPI